MPGYDFTNDTGAHTEIINADEVNTNFDNIQGAFLPLGANWTNTDNVYDLGSAAARWRQGFFGGSVTVGNLNSPAASITSLWSSTITVANNGYFGGSPANTCTLFGGFSADGAGVCGSTTSGRGVEGIAGSGVGIRGMASSGIGVMGWASDDNIHTGGIYSCSSGFFQGSVWMGQERYMCFVRNVTPRATGTTQFLEYFSNDSPLFPGFPYYTYQGALHFEWRGTAQDQYLYVIYPIYNIQTNSNFEITCCNDDTLYWKLIDMNNNLLNNGSFGMSSASGTLTITAYLSGTAMSPGHYILALYVDNAGGGTVGPKLSIDRWMRNESVIYSPYIVNKFLNSDRTATVNWTWNTLGDGVI